MHGKLYIKLMNSREWREARAEAITRQPLCVMCLRKGYYTPARCVHHIIPIESAHSDRECRRLAFAQDNLMPLCFQCHADIHRDERQTTREQHQQREDERVERWAERMRRRGRDPGGAI